MAEIVSATNRPLITRMIDESTMQWIKDQITICVLEALRKHDQQQAELERESIMNGHKILTNAILHLISQDPEIKNADCEHSDRSAVDIMFYAQRVISLAKHGNYVKI